MTVTVAAGGGGGKDNVGGSGLGQGLTTPFVLERYDCHVSLLSLSGVGLTPTLEVLLHASSLVVLSSESAALTTTPTDDGLQSAAATTNREELARAKGRIWGVQPGRFLSADADGDPARLGILPLPGKRGRAAADRTAPNGSGTNELLPVDHSVGPSHSMWLTSFEAFPSFL